MPENGPLFLFHGMQIVSFNHHAAGAWSIQRANAVEQCAFSGTGFAHNRCKIPLFQSKCILYRHFLSQALEALYKQTDRIDIFPVLDKPIFYADEHLVSLARKAAEGIERKIHFGFATTGDRYVEPVYLDILCIDMETAAAAHTCYLNNVPFVAIRSISIPPYQILLSLSSCRRQSPRR